MTKENLWPGEPPIELWTDPPHGVDLAKLSEEKLVEIILAFSDYYYMKEKGLNEKLRSSLKTIVER